MQGESLLSIIFTKDQGPQLAIEIGRDHTVAFDKFSFIGFFPCHSSPTIEDKWYRSIGDHPFAIIFSGNMQVCSCCDASLAGGMTNPVICLHPLTLGNTALVGDMQIKDIPAGLLLAIAIEVHDHNAVTRTDNQSRR